MPTPLVFEIPAFLLGLLLGSFLNVCISRLPKHQSLSKPRSHCPKCLATIRWYDNVPLLSWILLRARCRECKMPIFWRYPAVELAVGVWFFHCGWLVRSAFYFDGFITVPKTVESTMSGSVEAVGIAILGFLLIGLLVMDWQTHTLPNSFTLTGIALGFLLVCCQAVFLGPHQNEVLLQGRNPLTSPGNVTDRGNVILTGPEHLVLGRLLAIVAAGSILLIVSLIYKKLRKREGMGLGDAKLVAMIAAFLGFWPAILSLFLGFILCSIYALFLIARRRATLRARLPLGTFLAIGGLISALAGTSLIAWYTSLL